MGLDQHVVDEIVALIRTRFPDWQDVADAGFTKEERDYKRRTAEKAIGADGLLTKEALQVDLEGGAYQSFITRFRTIGTDSHLFFDSVPSKSELLILTEPPGDQHALCAQLFDLVWGPNDGASRLGRWIAYVHREGLQQNWPFPTCLLWICHPDEEMFIRPQPFGLLAKRLGLPWSFSGGLSADTYAAVRAWSLELRDAMTSYGAKDLVDVQSVMWVAGNALKSGTAASTLTDAAPAASPRYWKIAPGAHAWNWDACREGGFVSIGWEDLGDVGAMSEEEFDTRMAEEIANHDDWGPGAKQVWRFAHEIAAGDILVANRGMSDVIGFGRVTGAYEFEPGLPHGHHRAVDWFDTGVRHLPDRERGWLRTLMPLSEEKYAALLALAHESNAGGLGAPFSRLFADRAEAEAAFDLMSDALEALGVTSNDDERVAVTFSASAGKLSLYYGPWCLIRSWPCSQARRLQLSVPEHDALVADLPIDFRWKEAAEDDPVVLRTLEPAALTPEIRSVFLKTALGIRELFGHRRSSNWRSYHIDEIGAALLDPAKRDALLTDGLTHVVVEPHALGAPFDKIFVDRAEAEWAFDLLAQAFVALGVRKPDDPRISLTLPYGGGHLHLNVANWLILGFEPLASAEVPEMAVALLSDTPGIDRFRGGAFRTTAGDTAFSLKHGPRDAFRADPAFPKAMAGSQRAILGFFTNLKASSMRKHHCPEVAEAVFDPEIRERLLTLGLKEYRKMNSPLPADPAFSSEAQELLTAMAADPTKSFYAAHKDELTQHVQEPLQGLLKEAAARIAPTLQEALETTKKLFGVFPKNDWGKGGAWPYYWGAFYPLGGKKTEGCQLYVFLDKEGFSYGFSIGSYASEDRKRFAQNAEEYRGAIVATLGETVNTPDFEFGNENEGAAGHITKGIEGLDLAAWLEQGNKVGPHVHVLLPWAELLGLERERVVTDVVNAFNRLFPLVLLGTMDEPMPAIRAYMEDDIEDPEVNPPYPLDDLVAETSLPKKNLEAWLRAIDRKGQAILYGPPGTGKTYVAERLAKHLVAGGTGTAELVQFHPAYAYEDFMQGMRPRARDGGGLDYPIIDGRFKQFCDQARGRSGLSVLIIDEVNRANLARVFGELMYLLEYRDKSIPLAAGGRFSIPANVRLIGTMNTADRSIALVDHALRRRFAFLPLYPDYRMLTDYHAKNDDGYDPAKLVDVLKDLNRKIGDHHYEVGTSFFMRPDIAEQLPDVWSMEIEPYLEEYFFDQQATVDSFRWDEVKKKLGAE